MDTGIQDMGVEREREVGRHEGTAVLRREATGTDMNQTGNGTGTSGEP